MSPTEPDAVPVLPDTDDLIDLWAGLISIDPELGLLIPLGLLVLVGLAIVAVAGAVLHGVVPFLAANAVLIGLALAVTAVVVLIDRFTRPWFIEAESARLFHPPRRIWRIHGWWRGRRSFRAVVAAVAEGRIDRRTGIQASLGTLCRPTDRVAWLLQRPLAGAHPSDRVTFNPDGTVTVFGTGIHLRVKGEIQQIGLWILTFDEATNELLSAEYHGNFDGGVEEGGAYICAKLA